MKTGINTARATIKQLALLAQLGWVGNPAALTLAKASEAIEYLTQQRKAETDALVESAKRQAEAINLVEIAERFTELRRESVKEFSGPCPKCGGSKRFHVTAQWFFCRDCHEKRGGAIEFIVWREGCSFLDACRKITGGNLPMNIGEKVKPVSKPTETVYEWDEPKQKQFVMESHGNLINAGTRFAWQCMEYLQNRGIDSKTIKAFGIGYTAYQLPNTWDGKRFVYGKQLAISLPWFNHDGALVAVKYRFILPHIYTDKDGKEQAGKDGKGVRFTSRGQVEGNVFGWQALRKAPVLIVCEGEINALSLWQAGRGAVDVLSTGSESTTKHLPYLVVDLAKSYPHKIVWADKKEIADAAALRIGAASMPSPGGKDANDLLQVGKLGALLTAMLGRLGVSLPDEPPAIEPVNESHTDVSTVHTPTSHTDVLLAKGDSIGQLPTEDKAQPLRPVDTLIITDAKPLDFNLVFKPDPAPTIDTSPAPLPPMRMVTSKPPLPAELWLNGLTPAAAMAKWSELKQAYFCNCGADRDGWFVRCPDWQRLVNA